MPKENEARAVVQFFVEMGREMGVSLVFLQSVRDFILLSPQPSQHTHSLPIIVFLTRTFTKPFSPHDCYGRVQVHH